MKLVQLRERLNLYFSLYGLLFKYLKYLIILAFIIGFMLEIAHYNKSKKYKYYIYDTIYSPIVDDFWAFYVSDEMYISEIQNYYNLRNNNITKNMNVISFCSKAMILDTLLLDVVYFKMYEGEYPQDFLIEGYTHISLIHTDSLPCSDLTRHINNYRRPYRVFGSPSNLQD